MVGALVADGLRKHSSAAGSKDACPPVQTQPNFNLTSYVSSPWYAQQQMPIQYLPANSSNCVTAQYTVKERPTWWGYTITVDNKAQYDNGDARETELCANVPDSSNPAKLAVAPCFIWSGFAGPYWVLAYDEQEGYALISGGQPTIKTENGCKTGTGTNNSGLWIFTRTAFPAAGVVEKVRDIAKSQGFDLSVLVDINHEGCNYS